MSQIKFYTHFKDKKIHTGKRGGKYYIRKGKRVYVKKPKKENLERERRRIVSEINIPEIGTLKQTIRERPLCTIDESIPPPIQSTRDNPLNVASQYVRDSQKVIKHNIYSDVSQFSYDQRMRYVRSDLIVFFSKKIGDGRSVVLFKHGIVVGNLTFNLPSLKPNVLQYHPVPRTTMMRSYGSLINDINSNPYEYAFYTYDVQHIFSDKDLPQNVNLPSPELLIRSMRAYNYRP